MKMKHPKAAQTGLMMITGQSCVFGLLLLCLAVLGTSVPAGKPGKCPSERFLTEDFVSHDTRCRSDNDCKGTKKCCSDNGDKFCKPPAQEKPGTCPRATQMPRVTDFCTSDSECPKRSKCCLYNGGKTCVPSVKEKLGACRRKTDIMCIAAMRSTCASDSTCPDNEKCCPSDFGCYRDCQKPV
ncbi:WAP four-disulfide core domain protein 3 [Xenopus laevis]|uniref:WAP four-disulfide core domain protein 3 n=2 Tax=Xenopus laevis TaxID=8355 RepID=A0A1L8EME8_XENLA|nr:WAP four-disulfide core domain protein 3 [Xenopus laevis]OCT60536.1 hypothetical protein XELAEV_18046560mg [Xenopus laevis]